MLSDNGPGIARGRFRVVVVAAAESVVTGEVGAALRVHLWNRGRVVLREQVPVHVLAEALDEAEGLGGVRHHPGAHRFLGEGHVLHSLEAADDDVGEDLPGDAEELGVTNGVGGHLGAGLSACG